MSVDDADGFEQHRTDGRAAIRRIADVLGVPVEDLTDPSREPLNVRGLSELLTIWVEMDDDEDRRKLLDFARQLSASR